MSSRRQSPLRNRRVRALIVGLVLLLLVLGLSGVRSTMAAWTDSEQSKGDFAAATVPAPTLTKDCKYYPGILGLGAKVEVYWKLPTGYQLGDVVVEASTSGLGSVLAPIAGFSLTGNTTSTGGGTYTTGVPANLLGGLLGLGSELEVAFFVKHPTGWRSQRAAVASNAGLIAGLGGSCRNLT